VIVPGPKALVKIEHKKCSFNGCAKPVQAQGLCEGHYSQWHEGRVLMPLRAKGRAGSGHVEKRSGYVRRSVPHPNGNYRGQVYEHVLVMSNVLGRPLREGETVHHKNGVRHDNRPENLELWFRGGQPAGQRVKDLVTWARWLLDQYGEEFPA
jgi:hypothetical protein